MRQIRSLTWEEFFNLCDILADAVRGEHWNCENIFGIPTGGSIVAVALGSRLGIPVTDKPGPTTLVVDDIVDTGRTIGPYRQAAFVTAALHGRLESFELVDYCVQVTDDWILYPYEHPIAGEEIVTRFLQFIGEDPKRPGLLDTPKRVVQAWRDLFSGYQPLEATLTTFEEPHSDEMVVCREIEFVSFCEHHVLPFFGFAHVAYIPREGKVLGLSKLARLVDHRARRLQLQERLTDEIAGDIMKAVDPVGVGVMVEARHLCIIARGIQKQSSSFVTSSVHGALRERPEVRAEFMALVRGR